jgi:hypothetical protein
LCFKKSVIESRRFFAIHVYRAGVETTTIT